jgi:hypothetical protein
MPAPNELVSKPIISGTTTDLLVISSFARVWQQVL